MSSLLGHHATEAARQIMARFGASAIYLPGLLNDLASAVEEQMVKRDAMNRSEWERSQKPPDNSQLFATLQAKDMEIARINVEYNKLRQENLRLRQPVKAKAKKSKSRGRRKE